MRKFIKANAGIFQRLEAVELKQISTDQKINQILDRLDDGTLKQKLGIFFDGQMFDAYVLVETLFKRATHRIVRQPFHTSRLYRHGRRSTCRHL